MRSHSRGVVWVRVNWSQYVHFQGRFEAPIINASEGRYRISQLLKSGTPVQHTRYRIKTKTNGTFRTRPVWIHWAAHVFLRQKVTPKVQSSWERRPGRWRFVRDRLHRGQRRLND